MKRRILWLVAALILFQIYPHAAIAQTQTHYSNISTTPQCQLYLYSDATMLCDALMPLGQKGAYCGFEYRQVYPKETDWQDACEKAYFEARGSDPYSQHIKYYLEKNVGERGIYQFRGAADIASEENDEILERYVGPQEYLVVMDYETKFRPYAVVVELKTCGKFNFSADIWLHGFNLGFQEAENDIIYATFQFFDDPNNPIPFFQKRMKRAGPDDHYKMFYPAVPEEFADYVGKEIYFRTAITVAKGAREFLLEGLNECKFIVPEIKHLPPPDGNGDADGENPSP